jgi:hypothetical protein
MASGKRKRKQQGKSHRAPRPDRRGSPRKSSGSQAALGTSGAYGTAADLARGPAPWSAQPVGYVAPDEPEPGDLATWQHPALDGYTDSDEVPITIVPEGEEPPPHAGEYIGTANTTISMTDRDTGQEIPAPPGSRLYLRTTAPVAGIDTTVRVGSLREVEKIPARIVTTVPEGDTTGIRPGDVIAERQPVGYTDQAGEVIAYEDAGISLPVSDVNPEGSRVWRATAPASGPVTSYDIEGETFRQHAQPGGEPHPLPLADAARIQAVEDVVAGDPGPTRDQTDWQPQLRKHAQGGGGGRRQIPIVPPHLQKPAGPDELLRRIEAGNPGLAARLAQGLSRDELTALGPEIARALEAAGGEPGAYAVTEGEDGWPELVVTGSLEDVPGGPDDDTFVIEDLDADDPDDSGRVLMGSRKQVEAYHRAAREADARAAKLIPRRAGESGLARSYDAATAVRVRKTWSADEVLDMHAWLTRAYRHPSDTLADYLAFHIRQEVSDDHHMQSLFWPVDLREGADIPQGRQMAQLIARGLDDSRTFQVTAPMCHQLREDWNSAPGELLRLDEGILPVPAGFAWLDAPWLTEKLSAGFWLPVRAVSWERTIATLTSSQARSYAPAGLSAVDSVRVVLWLLIADDVAFGRWKGDEKRAVKVENKVGRLVPQQIALLPFGISVDTGRRASTNGKELMGLIHTLWTTLGEKLPKSRQIQASHPAVRARVQRSIKHGTVQIIPLREYDYIGEPNGHHPQARNWQCRWWVDEFYRHIDPYDDGTDDKGRRRRHKAVPASRQGTVLDDDHDICAVCFANGRTIRISLVRSFAKGPTSKPFRTPGAKKRTVYKLKR